MKNRKIYQLAVGKQAKKWTKEFLFLQKKIYINKQITNFNLCLGPMLRKHFMQRKINTRDIKHVIGHNGSIYIKSSLLMISLLWCLYIVFVVAGQYVDFEQLDWVFAGMGLILLIKYIIDFLNMYLDGLALSSEWITLFLREWLLEYKTEYFDRDKIVTINHQQNGIRDKIFNRWDLLINLEQGIEFPFENITAPKKQVDKIMERKDRYHRTEFNNIGKEFKEEYSNQPDDHMKIVMEAFGEVVKEYMEKRGG